MLGLLKLALALPALALASWQDVKRGREISNWAWLPLLVPASLSLWEASGDPLLLSLLLYAAWSLPALGATFHALGLWGDADAVFLALVALSFPWPPAGSPAPFGFFLIFPLLVALLSFALAFAHSLANAVRNARYWRELAELPLPDRIYILFACERGERREVQGGEPSAPLTVALSLVSALAALALASLYANPWALALLAHSLAPLALLALGAGVTMPEPPEGFYEYAYPYLPYLTVSLLLACASALAL